MSYKQYILSLFLMGCSLLAFSQVTPSGNIDLPHIPVHKDNYQIVNYPTPSVKLASFKDRLLILDFWATWCSPCRAFLSSADSLQKQFGDRIMILPVTYEDSKAVMTYLNSFKIATGISAPSIINDRYLNSRFYHSFIPHEVWIRPGDQSTIAITDDRQVNAANIQKVLDKQPVDWNMKVDYPLLKVDFYKPVLINNAQVKLNKDEILYKVSKPGYDFIITKYIKGMTSVTLARTRKYAANDTINYNIKAFNQDIPHLYQASTVFEDTTEALGIGEQNMKLVFKKDKKTEVGDELRSNIHSELIDDKLIDDKVFDHMNYQQQRDVQEANWCCFELLLKDTTLNSYQIVRKELNNYFKLRGISGKIIHVSQPVYVLKRTSKEDKVKSKGGQPEEVLNQYNLHYRNEPLNYWTLRLRTYFLQNTFPLYDETGLADEKVDMDLSCNMTNIDQINKALKPYDLQIIQSKKKIRQLIITQKE